MTHFENVERERDRKWGTGAGSGAIEDPVDNDAAKWLLVE